MDGAYGHDMMQDEEGRNELTEEGGYWDIAGRFPVDPAGDKDGDGGQQGDNDNQYREVFNDARHGTLQEIKVSSHGDGKDARFVIRLCCRS
jgi:hypothetical protein